MIQIRRMVGAASAAAMVAGALGLASAPAQADQPTGTVVSWSGDTATPVTGTPAGPWASLGSDGMDATTATGAIRADGTLDVITSAVAAAQNVPADVTGQRTVSFSVGGRASLWAVTADGSLHKWGGSRGSFPDRSWTPEELGGKAVQATGTVYRAAVVVKADDGTTHLVVVNGSSSGASGGADEGVYRVVDATSDELLDDVASISAFTFNRDGGYGLLALREDGSVVVAADSGAGSYQWKTALPASSDDPVVALAASPTVDGNSSIAMGTAITEAGQVVAIRADTGATALEVATWSDDHFPGVPEGESVKELNSTGLVSAGSPQYLLTDQGHVVAWTSESREGGNADDPVALPASMTGGDVLDIADGRYALVEAPAVAPLDVTTAATVSGTAQVGQTLTGTPAVFNDTSATVTNQWLADGDPIDGETGTTLTLTDDQLGAKISFRSTATRGDETKDSTSAQTDAVQAEPAVGSTTTVSAPGKAYGSSGTVTVTVESSRTPTGSVTLTGAGAAQTADVQAGKAVFTLPRTLGARRYTLTATYTSSGAQVTGSTGTGTFTVSKIKTKRPSAKISKKPTRKKAGKATVYVSRPSSSLAYATGKVQVVIQKGRSVRKVTTTLSRGTRAVTLPKLSKGTWKVTVKYLGDANYVAQSSPGYSVKVK